MSRKEKVVPVRHEEDGPPNPIVERLLALDAEDSARKKAEEDARVPGSQSLEKSPEPEDVAIQYEGLRKLMAERESQEIDQAKIAAPPGQLRITDQKRWGEIEQSIKVVMEGIPLPNEITFDPREVDAPVPMLKAYEQAAKICSEYSYAFGGVAAIYHWRRGQCFEGIRKILAPKGQWMEWYQHHGFEKSGVSRDIRLFKAVENGEKALIGMSEAAAHRKYVAKKRPKNLPSIKSYAEKEAEVRAGWLPCPVQSGPSGHTIGDKTSKEVVAFLQSLRRFDEDLATTSLEFRNTILMEIENLLATVTGKLPAPNEIADPDLNQFQPKQVPQQ